MDPCKIIVTHPPLKESTPLLSERSSIAYGPPSLSDYGSHGTEYSASAFVFTRSYKRRFWILAVFSILSWFQCQQWNMWGPISASMTTAFNWSSITVSMMGNWGSISFLVFVAPVCLFMQRAGVRKGVILCAASASFGPFLRWITFDSPLFTPACHICAILNGVAGTILLSAPPTIAAEWFPTHQRTTATAMIQGCNALGAVGSYLEPLIVKEPKEGVTDDQIKTDIHKLMIMYSAFSAALLLAVLVYFPNKPPCPPSFTSSMERVLFRPALMSVLKKKNVLLVVISFGVAIGGTAAWGGVLSYSLMDLGLDQNGAMWVGVAAAFATGMLRVLAGRFTDYVYGHLKVTLIVINLLSLGCYYWFLLITCHTIPTVKWQIYVSVVSGISLTFSTAPLYFELAVENAYPCLEVVVGGVASFINNLFSFIFLSLFFIKSVGYSWMIYSLLGFGCAALIPLLFVEETYQRAMIDRSPIPSPPSAYSNVLTPEPC